MNDSQGGWKLAFPGPVALLPTLNWCQLHPRASLPIRDFPIVWHATGASVFDYNST